MLKAMTDDFLNLFSDVEDSDDEIREHKFLTMPTDGKKAITKGWQNLTQSVPVKSGYNTAIVTGEISNLTVLDIDKPKVGELDGMVLLEMFNLIGCYTVRTPSGGLHVYFNSVPGIKTGVRKPINGKYYSVDIRSEGGYVLAPPSKGYQLINDVEIQDMPDELIDALISPDIEISDNSDMDSKNAELWEIFNREQPQQAKDFKPLRMKNGILNTTRLNASYCDICDRTHDNDNTLYLTIQEETRLFRGCIRESTKFKFIFDMDPKAKFKVRLPNAEEVEKEKTAQVDMLKAASDRYYTTNSRYISGSKKLTKRLTDPDTTGITAIKSEKGTGKTWTLAQEWKKPKYAKKRIQNVSFRVSLTKNMKKEFNNFKHYQDYEKLSINDKNIVCIDSLYKLNQRKENPSDKWSNDYLFIDEVSQVRLHTTSTTYLKQPRFEQNLKAFKNLIKNSKHIILTDANSTADDIIWINEIRGEGKGDTCTFQNNFRDAEIKRTFENIKKAEAIQSITDDVRKGRPAFVATNHSVDAINELERQVILAAAVDPKKILTIHSRNQNQPRQKAFILDPNTELKANDYLLIIISPCIQSGFNISLKNYIYGIYGIFCNSTNSPFDADQMLGRVRNPINNTIKYSFKNTNHNIGPTTANGYKKHLMANAHSRINEMDEAMFGKIEGDYNESGSYQLFNNSLLKLICKNKSQENRRLYKWHQIFIMRQLMAGHEVILESKKSTISHEELETVKTTAKQAKAEVKQEKAELLNNVTAATDNEVKEFKNLISKGESLTNQQQAQQEKHYLLNTYRIDSSEASDSKEWYLDYNDKKRMKAYRSQRQIFTETEAGGNLQAALKKIKLSDINRLKGRYLGDEPKDTEQKTADLAVANLKAAKIELLFEWLKILGITDNLYTRNLVEDDMYKALNTIHGQYLRGDNFEQTVDILGKNKKRTIGLSKMRLSEKGFTRKMLDFVNGSFGELLGFKINNASNNRITREYQIKNGYLYDGIFTCQKVDTRPYFCDTVDDDIVEGSGDELMEF
jgi:hypothetical protein